MKYDDVILPEFSAPWCSQCKIADPVLGEIGREVEVVRINADEDEDAVDNYNIRSLPTFILKSRGTGEVIDRRSGVLTLDQLREWIGSAVRE